MKIATQKSEEESRWGIVRLLDERQVVMSSGMSGVLLSGVGIDETTQWRRPQFWQLEDLREFNQRWQRELNEDGSNTIDQTYRIRKPGTNDPFEIYRSNYRLIRANDNLLYQICTFVDRG